eukprot:6460604-Pyramimonas_sp.AAC.1
MLNERPPIIADLLNRFSLPTTAKASSLLAICSTVVTLRGAIDTFQLHLVLDLQEGNLDSLAPLTLTPSPPWDQAGPGAQRRRSRALTYHPQKPRGGTTTTPLHASAAARRSRVGGQFSPSSGGEDSSIVLSSLRLLPESPRVPT